MEPFMVRMRTIGATFAGAVLLAVLALGPAHAQADVEQDWVRNYSSGNDPEFAFAYAVAVDASGNVYVTGSSYGPNGLADYATVKYSNSGHTLWVQRYNGPEDNWDAATELALDASGNVYVTGHSYGSNDFDYVTIKYSSSGTQEWVARYNGPGNTKDRAWGLGVDGSGNVYVTGDSGEGSPNLSDYVTVKYSPSGVQRWAARYSALYDYATALAVDASGNVYVTGYSYGSGSYYDFATIKYNARGRLRWVARYNGGIDDLAYALAVDAQRNVYVTGESGAVGKGSDYGTVKYDDRGVQAWVARYNGPGSSTDVANAIALDASGDVYVTGESEGSGTVADFATLKYSASGVRQWIARYNGPGNTFDTATALALDGSGNVFVTGRSDKVGGSVYTTIKYIQV